jgi:hypothetical protein
MTRTHRRDQPAASAHAYLHTPHRSPLPGPKPQRTRAKSGHLADVIPIKRGSEGDAPGAAGSSE